MGEQITNLDMSPGTYRNNIQTNDFDEVGQTIEHLRPTQRR
jgi:hypothetical protein